MRTVAAGVERGQSAVELMAGMIVVIPIFLVLVDLGAMLLASSVNDNIAKQAARAAGNQNVSNPTTHPNLADQAAGARIDGLLGTTRQAPSGIFRKIIVMDASNPPNAYGGNTTSSQNCDYDNINRGNVIVTTRVTVAIPIPVFFLPQWAEFTSRANAPIVAKVAQ